MINSLNPLHVSDTAYSKYFLQILIATFVMNVFYECIFFHVKCLQKLYFFSFSFLNMYLKIKLFLYYYINMG